MTEPIMFDDLKKTLPVKLKIIKVNDRSIEVKQYLSVNDKLNLITNVLKQVASNEDKYTFVNPVQMDVYTALEIIYFYTNIGFTSEQKNDPAKLYDELEKQEIINMVISAIPKEEYQFVVNGVEETINAYYNYRNSIRGIIEDVSTDYKNLDFDATQIQEKLKDPDNLTLLKDVVKKLG